MYALSQAIKVAGIKYHSFHSREKELDSFLEKVRSREAKETLETLDTDWNPLEAIHDKAKQELNLDTLSAYLVTRFPDRNHSDSGSVSALLSAILASGYTTIGEIDQLIDRGEQVFRLYEQEKPPLIPAGVKRFTDVGVIRAILHILDDRFLREDTRYKSADAKGLEKLRQGYEKYRQLIKQTDCPN